MKHVFANAVMALALATAAAPARAGIPVIDVTAIAQLIQQVMYWSEQIQLMVNQVNQLRQTYDSITGQRGMGEVLAISEAARNYLPEDWQGALSMTEGAAAAYGGAANQVQTVLSANAILTGTALDTFTPEQRAVVEDARRAAAVLQGLSQTAYGRTSQRFRELQVLIATIAATNDQKAALELSARIQAEQNMLQNEQTKLTTLYQAAQAQEWARDQRVRELGIQSVGTFRELPARRY